MVPSDEIVALGEGDADGISSSCLGSMFVFGDWNLARGFAPRPWPAGAMAADDGEGIGVEEMVAVAIGELATVGCGVELGTVGGDGVALGTSNRPRRCEGDETGEEVADGATVGATVDARLGAVVGVAVATGFGVEVCGTTGALAAVGVGED